MERKRIFRKKWLSELDFGKDIVLFVPDMKSTRTIRTSVSMYRHDYGIDASVCVEPQVDGQYKVTVRRVG